MSKSTAAPSFQPVVFKESNPRRKALSLRELPIDLQPANRLAQLGVQALSSAELLGLILRTGSKTENAIQVAEQLLIAFGSLRGIAQASLEELVNIKGVTIGKAAQIKASLELGRRLIAQGDGDRKQVRSPADIANLVMVDMMLLEVEEMRVIILDTKNYVTKIVTVYSGSLNSAVVRIAEIFKEAIRCNANGIAVCHNHPSGDPTPSLEDVHVTKLIVDAGNLLDIDVLDHVVVGCNRFVSMKERGLGFN